MATSEVRRMDIICPLCKEKLEPGDYVGTKWPQGYRRPIIDWTVSRERVKGNTQSTTDFFRCHNCGANVQVERLERVKLVED